jgi:hypothetical protein
VRHDRDGAVEHDRDVAAQQVGNRRRRTLVGHVEVGASRCRTPTVTREGTVTSFRFVKSDPHRVLLERSQPARAMAIPQAQGSLDRLAAVKK